MSTYYSAKTTQVGKLLDPAIGRQRQDAIEEIPEITTRLVHQLRDYVPQRDDSFQISTFVHHIDAVDLHRVQFRDYIF